jgi:hypothetical protein
MRSVDYLPGINRQYLERIHLPLWWTEMQPGQSILVRFPETQSLVVLVFERKGLGMNLLFSSITYGTTEPGCNRSHRGAIMHAANNGHKWIADLSPDKMGWDHARNAVIEEALKMDDVDAIMWVDSDIILPTFAITRMANYNRDFICGIYFQKEQPHFPLIMQLNNNKDAFQFFLGWPPQTLAPIDACGFGCVLTSMKMIRAMVEKSGKPLFHFQKFSEDLNFCLKAKDSGYQLLVDTEVICGHVPAPKPITYDEFKKCNPQIYSIGGKQNVIANV